MMVKTTPAPQQPAQSHLQPSSANIFAAGLEAAAELHDLSNRNIHHHHHHHNHHQSATDIKPEMSSMSSMYHHHRMAQSRSASHSNPGSDMHDMFDPISGSLPAALAAAASVTSEAGHHPSGSNSMGMGMGASQIHSHSALYSPYSHGAMNNFNSVNGMIAGLHPSQINAHQIQSPFHHRAHHHHPSFGSSSPHSTTDLNQSPFHHHPHHHHPSFAPSSPHSTTDLNQFEADPRELETFAERFKQRRIKLGVTQADVGRALANLKLPGVGSLSQSTICRFESLTLSHNNMVALKPILQAWLEAAEAQARKQKAGSSRMGMDGHESGVLPASDKKRKRTSIAAPEKRSLEAYFAVQPRPSGEKIAAIAEKLDLKKNVVRVWFCNQRQKQKRMKYSAANPPPAPGV